MSSDSDSDSDANDTLASLAKMDAIPQKSEERYLSQYQSFLKWQSETETTGQFTEKVLLLYFKKMSEKLVASTIWGLYSMLKKTIQLKQGIDISTYKQLLAFIKENSKGYVAKNKAKVFSKTDIQTFLENAPDALYLTTKVIQMK